MFYLSYYIRTIKGTVNFEDKKVNKKAIYKNKKPYDVYDIDTEKILVSKKESYGKKVVLNILLDIMMKMLLDLCV